MSAPLPAEAGCGTCQRIVELLRSLLCNNNTAINLQTFTSRWVVGIFSRATKAPFAFFFHPEQIFLDDLRV